MNELREFPATSGPPMEPIEVEPGEEAILTQPEPVSGVVPDVPQPSGRVPDAVTGSGSEDDASTSPEDV
jgi:hypothetical protein